MNHNDFKIGLEFYMASRKWRCTDIGKRVIIAIKLDAPDNSWYNGPPYAVNEIALDEYDLKDCTQLPKKIELNYE